MPDPNADPVIRSFREQLSDNDRAILEAINTRLELVARLKAHKEARGLDFVDPAREEWVLATSRARTAARSPGRVYARSTQRSST